MAIIKTAILLEQDLSQKTDGRQENLALLEEINAAHDDTPDPESEKALKASQRAFIKVLDSRLPRVKTRGWEVPTVQGT